ncbi:retrovirus-related pol polyprotein from transposon TNT 1-94 [Tanacetum coccineum]
MLIYAKAHLFLWAEAVATACYTQNRSIIWLRHGKTPYELLHDRKPYLSYLHVFGALCYPTNDSENLGKFQAKADIGIFIGYAPKKKAYRIYNRHTRKIIKNIHVDFDELAAMASEQSSLELALHEMTPATPCSGLVPNPLPLAPFAPPTRNEWDLVFQPVFDEFLSPPTSFTSPIPKVEASALAESTRVTNMLPVGMTISTSSNHYGTTSTNDNVVLPGVTNILPVGMTKSTSSNHYGTTSTNDNIVLPGVTNMLPVGMTISTSSNHYGTTSTNDNIILPGAHDPDYVPEPIYHEYIPLEDEHEFPAEEQPFPPIDSPTTESPGYVTESDPEEDPEEYEDDETEMDPVLTILLDGEIWNKMTGATHLRTDEDEDDEDEDDEDEEGRRRST